MKNDYKILVFCSALLLVIAVALLVFDHLYEPDTEQKTDLTTNNWQSYDNGAAKKTSLHAFDPNTASAEELVALGVPEWTTRSIMKYRAKGGVFSTPEDFARMHGITVGLYKRLLPYIQISEDFKPAAELVGPRTYPKFDQSTPTPRDTTLYPEKIKTGQHIDINHADTNQLKKIPGVGSYFANKIVALRERYGGFNSLSQLLTIKGLPEDALQYMIIPDGGIKKININTASFKALSQHPAIGYKRTKYIFEYRRLKGRITSLKQLSLIPGFSAEEIELMEPYIEY